MDIKVENNSDVIYRSLWLYEEILAMINFVQSKPYLYDRRDADYNKNQKKNYAWEEISEILKNKSHREFPFGNIGQTVLFNYSKFKSVVPEHHPLLSWCFPKECKRKWSTLRIQQRRILITNLTKKRKSVQWQFYEPLQFLTPHMEVSISNDNTQSNISDESEEEETESSSYMDNDSKNYQFQVNNSSSNNETGRICHGTNDNNPIILSYHSEHKEDSVRTEQSDSNTTVVISKADTISNNFGKQCNCNKDDISLNYFLMDVQLQMSKMNPFAQMELKIGIQELILEKLRKPENLKNE